MFEHQEQHHQEYQEHHIDSFWQDLKSGKFAAMVKESSKGQAVSNASEVCNVLKPMITEHDDIEVLYGIFLDAKNHIIAIENLFSGSITGTQVYPREILKRALSLKAVALILAHNHPSGDTTPSIEDKAITTHTAVVLTAMSISLHDHIIIGNDYYSMADSGWLRQELNRIKNLLAHC